MKILQLCFRMPWPLKDGGAIAMYNLSMGLVEIGHELSLFVPLTHKHDVAKNDLPESFKKVQAVYTTKINTDITPWGAFLNLFSRKSYYISRYEDKQFAKELTNVLQTHDYDLVILESVKVAMYAPLIRKFSKAKVVMRSHNVEFKIWERHAKNTSFPKNLYLNLISKRLKKFELQTLNDFDAVLPITGVDGHFFKQSGCKVPVIHTPTGIISDVYQTEAKQTEAYSCFHLGALDWMPNQEAVKWFIHEVWPLVQRRHPKLKFYLAGRNMPAFFRKFEGKGIEVIGEVPDAKEFMLSKNIMLVPLLSGSGMRIKIIEGMALGKVIISTSIGAEGITYTHKKNILIADTPQDFSNAIDLIFSQPELQKEISKNARQLIRDRYDNKAVVSKMMMQLQEDVFQTNNP